MRSIYALTIVLLFGFFAVSDTQAQTAPGFDLSSFTNSIAPLPEFGEIAPGVSGLFTGDAIISTPTYPGPFEQFSLELSIPDVSYSGASIKWYVDGEEDTVARNKRQHTLIAGDLGETMDIRVVITKQNGVTKELTRRITPTQIDIVLEGLTTVPDFYKGRAVPAQNTTARAVAIVSNGQSLERANLTYEWRLNGSLLEVGAIRGLQAVEFQVPIGLEHYLEVTISDQSGEIAAKGVTFRPAEPEIVFYEQSPITGVVERALGDEVTVAGNQITLQAEPYYFDPNYDQPGRLVEWNLGGQVIDNSTQPDRNVITLQGSGTNSGGLVSLRLADLTQLSLPTSRSIFVQFGF